MVQDAPKGQTRGFGFVTMATPEEARAAIAKLNGTKVGEKSIYVTEAREKPGGPPKPFGGPPRKEGFDRRPEGFSDRPPRRFDGPRQFDRGAHPSFGRPARPSFGRDERGDGFGRSRGPRRDSRGLGGEGRAPGGFPERPRRSPYKGFSAGPRPSRPENSEGSRSRGPRSDSGRPPLRTPPKRQFWSKFDKKHP